MRLPLLWENFLQKSMDLSTFYNQLDHFTKQYKTILPQKDKIFAVFNYINPHDVNCVLYGEDPYPRATSACGVAFWDKEIISWNDRTNGNSLKNILKALFVARGMATYFSKIDEVREMAVKQNYRTPPQLFEHWLDQGILLLNASLTFTSAKDKTRHFEFWKPFHKKLINALNNRKASPVYILWGSKAQKWEQEILQSVDDPLKIIRQGHPTFIHQFLDKNNPGYSPFTEIMAKTKLTWY